MIVFSNILTYKRAYRPKTLIKTFKYCLIINHTRIYIYNTVIMIAMQYKLI